MTITRARAVMAKELAAWCWTNGVTSEQVECATDADWVRLSHLAIGADSSPGVRLTVQAMLALREVVDDGRPVVPLRPRE